MRTATSAPEIANTKMPTRSRVTRVLGTPVRLSAERSAAARCTMAPAVPRWRRLAATEGTTRHDPQENRHAMAHLTLAGVSDDGKRLLLVSDKGEEFTLDITPGLRAALRGDTSRLGQLEIQMESALRPRDIQARIRAGETPEAVAQAAQTTVEKIMPFAGPVLAEREHVAERAQRSSVRRAAGDAGAGPHPRRGRRRSPARPSTSTPTASTGTPGAARTAAGR